MKLIILRAAAADLDPASGIPRGQGPGRSPACDYRS